MDTSIKNRFSVSKLLRNIDPEDRRVINQHLTSLWDALEYVDNKKISSTTINEIKNEVDLSGITNLINNHINNTDNPHSTTLEQVRVKNNIISGNIVGDENLTISLISDNPKNLVTKEWVDAQGFITSVNEYWKKTGSVLYPINNGDNVSIGNSSLISSADKLSVHGNTTISGNLDILNNNIANIGIAKFDITTDYPCKEGQLAWDNEPGTLKLGMPGGNVCGLMFEEIFLPNRPKNDQGTDIDNGSVVYLSGATGNVPSTKLASAADFTGDQTIAMSTEDIASDQRGFYTSYGLVNELDTTFGGSASEGDDVFLDVASGKLTLDKLNYPNSRIKIGYIVRVHAELGSIFVTIDKELWLKALQAHKNPTGFPDKSLFTMTYDKVNRRITLTPNGDYFPYFLRGVEHRVNGVVSFDHPDITGNYFLYVDADNNVQFSTTTWEFSEVQVAFVYWNSTKQDGFAIEERHGCEGTSAWHEGQHNTIGTYYKSGLGADNYVVSPSSPSDSDNQHSVDVGTIKDEDLTGDVAGVPAGGPYYVLYRSGVAGEWLWDENTVPFIYDTNIEYNEFNGASWVNTEVANNRYVNCYDVSLSALEGEKSVIIIVGQKTYASLAGAEAATIQDDIDFGTLPFPEFSVIHKFTYKAQSSYGTLGKCRIEDYVDLRGTTTRIQVVGTTPTSNHNSLLNIQGGLADEYYHLKLSDYSALTDPNAQLAALHTDGLPTFDLITSTATIGQINTLGNTAVPTVEWNNVHINDSDIHFTEDSISHLNISDIGTNNHAQIDSHISNISNPHSVSLEQARLVSNIISGTILCNVTVETIDSESNKVLVTKEWVDDQNFVNEWTLSGTTLYPKSTDTNVVVGGTAAISGAKLSVWGNAYIYNAGATSTVRIGSSGDEHLAITHTKITGETDINSYSGGQAKDIFFNSAGGCLVGKNNILGNSQIVAGQSLNPFTNWAANSALNGIKDWSTTSGDGANIGMYAIGSGTAVTHSGVVLGGAYWSGTTWTKYSAENSTYLINHPKNANIIQIGDIADFNGASAVKCIGIQGAGGYATAKATGQIILEDYRITQIIDSYNTNDADRETELNNLLFKRLYNSSYDNFSISSKQIAPNGLSGGKYWIISADDQLQINAGSNNLFCNDSSAFSFRVGGTASANVKAVINSSGIQVKNGNFIASNGNAGVTNISYTVQVGDQLRMENGIITLVTLAS